MFLHGTSRVNEQGHLEIGGVDVVELAKTYGTPLYIYDVALIRARARAFKEAFQRHGVRAQVAYASKAFSAVAIVQLAAEEGLSLDVVSGGELYTALAAGFPPERIHFHGNNKSRDELAMALEHGIGCIVADNFYELELIEELAASSGRTVPVLLRVTPGVEAHTHDYILTGQEDSKFGFDLNNGQADEAFRRVMASAAFQLLGVHCHIGSQILKQLGLCSRRKSVCQAGGVEQGARICPSGCQSWRRLWHPLYGGRRPDSGDSVRRLHRGRGEKAGRSLPLAVAGNLDRAGAVARG